MAFSRMTAMTNKGAVLGITLAMTLLAGCSSIQRDPPVQVWDDMKHQPKFKAQSELLETDLLAHRRISQLPQEDTIARGHLHEDSAINTGREGGMYVGKMPIAITPELIKAGQTKFNIYCSPCHDQTGMGKGIVPSRVPTWQPSNLTEDRVVQFADGDLFDVISNGRRTMPGYKFQIVTQDRWAIIAYVRALQRAAHAKPDDVPAGTTIASN